MSSKKKSSSFNESIKVSQNFITNKKIIERIVRLSTIEKKDLVIEIGTGKGHLTKELCKRSSKVISIEIDKNLCKKNNIYLANIPNLKLIEQDFLNYNLPKREKYKIFANIPFSITTKIITKLTETSNLPQEIYLVVEKGAAKRFMGIKKENKKSLLLKVNWEMEIVYNFKSEDFHPKPSVEAVLLHFRRKTPPDLDRSDYFCFKRFIDYSLNYGLFGNKSLLSKKQIFKSLKLAGFMQIKPTEDLDYLKWLCLFKYYREFQKMQKK